MTYQAEVYLLDTMDLIDQLGEFEAQDDARTVCTRHARQTLRWELRRPGLWESQGEGHWYRVIAQRP